MRQITRTLSAALVLTATLTLTATSALAAPPTPRPKAERATVTEIAQRLMKRIFGTISINSDLSLPKPDNSSAPDGSGK